MNKSSKRVFWIVISILVVIIVAGFILYNKVRHYDIEMTEEEINEKIGLNYCPEGKIIKVCKENVFGWEQCEYIEIFGIKELITGESCCSIKDDVTCLK